MTRRVPDGPTREGRQGGRAGGDPAPELRDETRRALESGIALFDGGRFFEAHEAWEAAWRVERGEVRRMLQGLIQLAAGYHQATVRRRPRGAAKLLASGLAKLEPIGDGLAGLRLGPVREAVAAAIEAARAWERGERDGIDPACVARIARGG